MCCRLPDTSRTEAVISCSVIESSAEVASSKMKSRGWRRSARAIERRCRSPPETRRPLSPRRVSSPWPERSSSGPAEAWRRAVEHLLVGGVRLHELQVLADRAREQLRVLGDEADLPADAVVAQLGDRDAVDRDDPAPSGCRARPAASRASTCRSPTGRRRRWCRRAAPRRRCGRSRSRSRRGSGRPRPRSAGSRSRRSRRGPPAAARSASPSAGRRPAARPRPRGSSGSRSRAAAAGRRSCSG